MLGVWRTTHVPVAVRIKLGLFVPSIVSAYPPAADTVGRRRSRSMNANAPTEVVSFFP